MHPFLLQYSNYNIPTYIFVISVTSVLCLIWTQVKARRMGLDAKIALDLALMILVGGFIGGRLMHIFYEGFYYYKVFPLDAFRFWDGGFVYYGGWIGGCILSTAVAVLYNQPVKFWADFFAPILAFGYGLGRLACFFNGCCYGKLCDLPWAISFSHHGLPGGLRHPTALYATAWELLLTLPILLFLSKRWALGTGRIFYSWMVLHGIGRIVMEAFRADERGEFLLGLSVSTWISLALITGGSLAFLASKKATPKAS